jgi:hypothetical protein
MGDRRRIGKGTFSGDGYGLVTKWKKEEKKRKSR